MPSAFFICPLRSLAVVMHVILFLCAFLSHYSLALFSVLLCLLVLTLYLLCHLRLSSSLP